jgi:hypothetical protein
MILPWFGGSSSVWSTCLVFFQAELLLGYLYVHLLHESLSPRRQNLVHCVLLLLSLATLPVIANPAWKDALSPARPGTCSSSSLRPSACPICCCRPPGR